MDTALQLRIAYEQGKTGSDSEIDQALSQSALVEKLSRDWESNRFFAIFRLICFSEIPFAERLPYVKKLLDYVTEEVATEQGFSYTGKVDFIVPCYNAMLLEAYTRLGKADSPEVHAALAWIKEYQVFERNKTTRWPYQGICKHGGCLRSVPCYIGIGKTTRALIAYAEHTSQSDPAVQAMIHQGAEYMLKHHFYQRLSNQKPISPHITDIMFPQAYMLSVTDLVYIANKCDLWGDPRSNALQELLDQKAVGEQQWKLDYIYGHKGYKAFETRRKPSEWIHHCFTTN
ncbi:hypothetical protein NRIC_10800 [Enterococcus florum]|uniref:Alpha-macroglobulin-like TED domain-containing protein n=1 Tax=Enterococcus florum TaxID=2480627 RepID=A0A4V0WPA6_9ENTE|nr:hypothetical protein [Enterococcus florum]GCF93189.1 hypothetical protein NRIC_10800 [Enterococcus florum]